jgi:hypothetical protein
MTMAEAPHAETYIAAADQHGADSDTPEHTIGDLEALFRAAHGLLTPEQRTAFASLPEVAEVLEWLR